MTRPVVTAVVPVVMMARVVLTVPVAAELKGVKLSVAETGIAAVLTTATVEGAIFAISEPDGPTSPLGMVKANTAADEVPLLVTEAREPGVPVAIVGVPIVAASPLGPEGMLKLRVFALVVGSTLFVTVVVVPVAVTLPTFTVAAGPVAPVVPVGP